MLKHSEIRALILSALYDAREANPKSGWLTAYQLRDLVGDAGFDFGVLAELGHISADGNRYRITGQGVLAHEAAGK